MIKIPSPSKIKHPSWTDSKAVQFLPDACKDSKHYFEKSLNSQGKHRQVELLNMRSLQILSLILLLGIYFGIQGIAPALSATASGPVTNMRTGQSY